MVQQLIKEEEEVRNVGGVISDDVMHALENKQKAKKPLPERVEQIINKGVL